MKRILSIIFTILLVSTLGGHADAQSLMQTAKKAEQRAKELKQQETFRYNAIVESKDLTKYNQYITDYPRGSKTPEIKRRAEEVRLWNNARSTNSILSYQNYLNSTQYHWYDTEANNSIKSLKQAIEKAAWEKVKQTNTLQCYQDYLKDNPTSGYRTEAEQAINRIQGAAAWEKVRNSNSIPDLQSFVNTYPYSVEINLAKNKLYELQGCEQYDSGNLGSAYSSFSKVSRENISYANRTAYDAVMEYHDFSNLNSYSSESSLLAFLRKYPNSIYKAQVNNLIAVSKAKSFGDYASNYDYNQALSYATDPYTRKTVESYISINKKKQKDRRNALKSWERKQNGGTVSFGLDFMDMGWNCESDNGTIFYYNLGLLFRIGNYKDWVQFVFGIKPGLIGYDVIDYGYYYDSSEMETGFHMPIVGQLKLNLFKTSDDSRFFAYGQYQYNAVRIKDVESEMSWAVGFGIGWKRFDCSLYYRQDTGRPLSWDYDKQHYLGMSMIYYWQL